MNLIDELTLHAKAFAVGISTDATFFAPISHYVNRLVELVTTSCSELNQSELRIIAINIDQFYGEVNYRITEPPTFTTQRTENQIIRVIRELNELTEGEFRSLIPTEISEQTREEGVKSTPCVFIGHGRSKLWARVQVFLQDEKGLKTVHYDSESRTSESIVPILEDMLDKATFAVLVVTAEDKTQDGGVRARQNVVHEIGLFQGNLGFPRVVLLQQDGVEEFTNIDGLQYIPFSGDDIENSFYRLERVLKREGLT